jgi:outer membrane protein OmpA-like peptidoglycan-associated protein
MEPRFGRDFSRVRVHTDASAAESARAVNARAYTVGWNVVFAAGQYAPGQADARRLLAHELTHVVQQRGNLSDGNLLPSHPRETSGRKPDSMSASPIGHADSSSRPPARGVSPVRLQRACPAAGTNLGATPGPDACIRHEKRGPGDLGEFIHGQRLLFCRDWDELLDGQEGLLEKMKDTARSAVAVALHGNASAEGPSEEYNFNLACRRAAAVKKTFQDKGVTAPIALHSHGPVKVYGDDMANRNVTMNTLHGGPPKPQPGPLILPEPKIEPSNYYICGPDITSALTKLLGTVDTWFWGLTSFQRTRSCEALGPGAPLVGVDPLSAWDTWDLFLPNTSWLDFYFRDWSCGSPRDPGCAADPTRHLCEKVGTCGNSVVVDGKCMLAGTANYALFGKICRLCHDYDGSWNRSKTRSTIGSYKSVLDDPTPPTEIASAAYDGTFPTVPAAAENRGICTGRCGQTHSIPPFDFIWEPYKPR